MDSIAPIPDPTTRCLIVTPESLLAASLAMSGLSPSPSAGRQVGPATHCAPDHSGMSDWLDDCHHCSIRLPATKEASGFHKLMNRRFSLRGTLLDNKELCLVQLAIHRQHEPSEQSAGSESWSHDASKDANMQSMLHETHNSTGMAGLTPPDAEEGTWLLLIYRIPAEHSSARTTIWREVKRLGPLALQHAVFLLPRSDANRAAYDRLARRIEESGGEATILETRSPTSAWHEMIVQRFNAARDEEYDEVVDETERFREEIDRERRKNKFTFAELEDEESNLERLRKYLAQVEARDTFGASGRARAVEEVERCATVLETFAQEIYERHATSDDGAH